MAGKFWTSGSVLAGHRMTFGGKTLTQGVVLPQTGGPDGIDATGATDVTIPFNQWLAAIPNGTTVTLPFEATYRIEGIPTIDNKAGITINGNGATIIANDVGYLAGYAAAGGTVPIPAGASISSKAWITWMRGRAHLNILNSDNITINNLNIRGANPNAGANTNAYDTAYEGQHGVWIRGSSNVFLNDMTVTDVWGDLLFGGASGNATDMSDWSGPVTIRRCHFERSGRQVIALIAVKDWDIQQSFFGGSGRSMIDIEPALDTQGAVDVLIKNNDFGTMLYSFFICGGRSTPVDNIRLENNRGISKMAVSLTNRPDYYKGSFYYIGNTCSSPWGNSVVTAERFSHVEVRNNVIPLQPKGDNVGVFTNDCETVIVSGNTFANAGEAWRDITPTTLEIVYPPPNTTLTFLQGKFYETQFKHSDPPGTDTWSVDPAGDPLPTGLSMQINDLEGTPTTVQTRNVIMKVTNPNFPAATRAVTMQVITPPPLAILTPPDGTTYTFARNVTITQVNFTATVVVANRTWSIGTGPALPAGLAFSSGGKLTGTPTTPGTSNVVFKVTAGAETDTITIPITVT